MSDNQAGNQGSDSPFSDDAEQEVVRQMGRTAPDGSSYGTFTLTPASDTRQKELLCDVRPIIPVIFLPGIMGSLLANKKTGEEMFYAPNTDGMLGNLAALPALIGLWCQGPSSRQTDFNPENAAVTPLGPINVGKHGNNNAPEQSIDEAEARRRGWGSIHRTSYHPVLAWLEETLNQPKMLGEPHGPWINPDPNGEKWTLSPVIGTDPAKYGAFGGGGPIELDSLEFAHFTKFRYRVYAIGYNWLQSNDASAKQVVDGSDYEDPQTKKKTRLMGIKEIIAENHSDKAIILTHSMGGLVARFALANCDAENLIHGVFHNVQPATGAPIVAKRFRTGGGNEGGMNSFINGALAGPTAKSFAGVAANSPGALELLPMPDYREKEPWWIFARINGDPVMQLPQNGSAFKEIYANKKWYGLAPEEELLDPTGNVKERLNLAGYGQTVYENFVTTLGLVTDSQIQITNRYHAQTYVSYGNGGLPPGMPEDEGKNAAGKQKIEKGQKLGELLSWGKVVWTGNVPMDVTEDELRAATFLSDSYSGKYSGKVRVHLEARNLTVEFEVQKVAKLPNGTGAVCISLEDTKNGIIPGDGTVPVWSARSQARGVKPGVKGDPAKGVQMVFEQGGYPHQFSYEHPWARWALLYSIVQIVKNVKEPSC